MWWEETGTSVRPDKFVGTLNPAKGGGGDLSPPPVIECSEHPRSSRIAPQSLGDLGPPPVIECSEHSEECTEMISPGRDLRLPWEGTGTSIQLLRNHSATLAPPPVIECSECSEECTEMPSPGRD